MFYYNKKANKFDFSYKDIEAMEDLLCPLLSLRKRRSEESIKESRKKIIETTI